MILHQVIKSTKMKIFKLSFLTSLILFSFNASSDSEDYFDPALLDSHLGISSSDIDLSQFSQKDSLPEGMVNLTIFVNSYNQGEQDINLIKSNGSNNKKIIPEITPKLLKSLGVKVDSIPKLNKLPNDEVIEDITQYIPDASIVVNFSQLKLIASFPQIVMNNEFEGYIDPSLYDDGVPAMFINYMLSGSHSSNDITSSDGNDDKHKNNNFFAQLRGGVNIKEWRLRSTMTQTYSRSTNRENTNSDSKNSFNNTYVYRAIQPLRSELIIGETSSVGEIFDSIPLKGLRLVSNEQMLPSSQQGFAPDITGIAQSNAKVTIRQNGNIVYQTYVAPGPFKITDLYASGSGGNLDVTITEEDGRERSFTVAFSTLPVMLRTGGWRYELNAGRFDGGTTIGSKKSNFFSATGVYGLPHDITVYGGVLGANKYYSLVSGVGASLGSFGALSADITHAQAKFDTIGSQTGQSYRVRYSKNMTTTGTLVDLTALRFSTKNYYDFNQFNTADYELKEGSSPWLGEREKSRLTTSISQTLGRYGSIYLSGSRYNYWENDKNVTQLTTGYNGSIAGINYGIAYSIDRVKSNEKWPENRQINFNVNIPFSVFSNQALASNLSSTYMLTHDNKGKTSQQVGLSGSALDNNLSYGVSQSWGNQQQVSNGSLYGNYSGNYGTTSINYNYSKDYHSVNGSMNGGMLIHSNGITLSRNLGDNMAIIEAKGAGGTELNSGNGKINRYGYGVSPYLAEYRNNTIGLNVNTLPDDVTLKSTSKNVVPTRGAIVKVAFETKLGFQAIFNIKQDNNDAIPFGATATLIDPTDDTVNSGIVGDNGQLYMSGLPDSGTILVEWGQQKQNKCYLSYQGLQAININSKQPIRIMPLLCK